MKTIVATLLIMVLIALPFGSIAIEPPEGVTIPYEGKEMSYDGDQFTEVLEAYGLSLTVESAKNLPPCFGVVKENTTEFGRNATSLQCTPNEYHSILTAFGLTLTSDDVISKLGKMDTYATVREGKVVFSDEKVFLWSSDWKNILGAYSKAK